MKIYMISCCGECPACVYHDKKMSCRTMDKVIGTADDVVNPGLVGVPSWCPLKDAYNEGNRTDYRKVARKMAKILESGDYGEDAIAEASYYLNSVMNEKSA